MTIRLERVSPYPILEANPDNDWEKAGCFNAGAIIKDDIVHLFYRATDKNSNGRECPDYMNYIGHAKSDDGIHFTRDSSYLLGPVPDSQYSRGCEDPRVVKTDNKYYMLYTGYGARYPDDYRICMASSNDLVNWEEHGIVLDESNKDAALLPD
ncbi:MAG: glycosidase, partial [Clostridia bacterium]|nr:glycosidase [Clostridia bacterium]